MLRSNIKSLAGIIALAAVSLAAFRTPSPLWASIATSAACGWFLVAAYVACWSRGSTRAYWSAVAFFGGSYMLATFGPWFDPSKNPRPCPATSYLIDVLYHAAHRSHFVEGQLLIGPRDRDLYERFQRIGHSLLAILMSYAAGRLASALVAAREGDERSHSGNIRPAGPA